MLWRYKDEIFLCSYSKNHIDVTVRDHESNIWRLTGLYGEPDRSKIMEIWQLIRTLASNNLLPWCLIGDANSVYSQIDKKGGKPYLQRLIQGFQEVLEDCRLIDMNLQGHQFSWERGVGSENWI